MSQRYRCISLQYCPCCAAEAFLYETNAHRYRVYCSCCGLQTRLYKQKRHAIDAWNIRTERVHVIYPDAEAGQ